MFSTPPFKPMLWVSEPTSTPVGREPAYIDEKLARLLLKPKVPALAMLLLTVVNCSLMAWMPDNAISKLISNSFQWKLINWPTRVPRPCWTCR